MESEIYLSDGCIVRIFPSDSDESVVMSIETEECDVEQPLTPDQSIELGQFLIDIGSSLI